MGIQSRVERRSSQKQRSNTVLHENNPESDNVKESFGPVPDPNGDAMLFRAQVKLSSSHVLISFRSEM